MDTVLIRSRSGADSKLRLEVTVGQPDTEFDVEVVARPSPSTDSDWPEGYFDLFSSITDETFERPPQGSVHSSRRSDSR